MNFKEKLYLFLYSVTILPLFYITSIPLGLIFGGRNLKKKEIKYEEYPKGWNDLLIGSYINDNIMIDKFLNNSNNDINYQDFNGWTSLHVAVSNKSLDSIKLLLEKNINHLIQTKDKGYTALHIAASNGNLEIIEMMIQYDKMPSSLLLSNELETPLLMAITNNHGEIANLLLNYYSENKEISNICSNFNQYIDQYNVNGVSPIIMSVLRSNYQLLSTLVLYGADVNNFKKDNSNSLHCAAITNNSKIIKYLIDNGTNTLEFNRYGNAPIHEACIKGNSESILAFVEKDSKLSNLKDKDGSSPLHLCCNCSMSKDINQNLESIKILYLNGKANLNQQDNGGSTPLHVLACNEANVLPLVQFLLDNGANPTIENKHGWSVLHQAYNNKHAKDNQIYSTLLDFTKDKYPLYLENYIADKKKQINYSNDIYTSDRDELKRIGLERLNSIASKIKSGEIKKVIFLTGAGISANAGIPPYRTKDGLLNRNQTFSFSTQILKEQPELFYDTILKYFYPTVNTNSNVKPTLSHQFINSFSNKGILLRNYTQNIDPLQERSNTPDDLIVHAHGSFNKWYCTECKKEYDKDNIWFEISRGGIPYCTESSCREIIRPNVIFFGEPLPLEFKKYSISDFREGDCLFIMGTSLQVYPFSGLLNDCKIDIPRVLINFESTGPFRSMSDLISNSNNNHNSSNNNNINNNNNNNNLIIESRGLRDIVILGDCDKGVEFCNKLFFQ